MKRTRRREFTESAQADKESAPKRIEVDVWMLVLPGIPPHAAEQILVEAGLNSVIGVCTAWRRAMLPMLNFRLARTLESWIRGTVDDGLPWGSKICALVHRLLSNGAISLDQIRAQLAGRLSNKSPYFITAFFMSPELRKPSTVFCPWGLYSSDQEIDPFDLDTEGLYRLRAALESGMSPSALHTVLMRLPANTPEDPTDPTGTKFATYRRILGQIIGDLFLHEYPVALLRAVVRKFKNSSEAFYLCSHGTGYAYPVAVSSPAYVLAVATPTPLLSSIPEFLLGALEAARTYGRWGKPHQELLKADLLVLPANVSYFLRRTGKIAFKQLDFADMLRHSWCSIQSFDHCRIRSQVGCIRLRRDELLYINANFETAMSPPWFMAEVFHDFPDPVSAVRTIIGEDPTGLRAEFIRSRVAQYWSGLPSKIVWTFELLELAGYGKPMRQPKNETGAIELPVYYTELASKVSS